ncbi:OLC1v1009207C1 [Oldenlandia corymbosa var. corymbosa]|uniref:OLC1v1009207C1 n=1 Tax=Oldenlandia corymbosa var. corymbosa TaxID=529605 RepID=A0AAV1DRA4_OLDCO|nr:OLC1v1009207C1 [Oldenlandia corymbosa var. corymbosa]
MGIVNSKGEKTEALRLCKERKRFIKQAIDSRYALAAAHVAYVESLKNIGIALRRYAEAEFLIESSLSASAAELDKTPSHFSYPSPSPSHVGGVSDSPVLNGSPLSPPAARMSYMMSGGTSAVTVRMSPTLPRNMYLNDSDFSRPLPPPPPPPDVGSHWDFFDPGDDSESFRFVGSTSFPQDLESVNMNGKQSERVDDFDAINASDEVVVTPKSDSRNNSKLVVYNGNQPTPQRSQSDGQAAVKIVNSGSVGTLTGKAGLEPGSRMDKSAVDKDVCAEREDPSEFITHRAKDFLSSIKDIEHRFFRASESGKEVSRMLEANKIHVGYADATGKSPIGIYLASLKLAFCSGKSSNVTDDPEQTATKVITWKRTTSSRSSSSRNPLTSGSKDDNDDSGSEFMEEFCMISGSHSSTLDRLYAWERKLYDEVKASESIRKVYDSKCNQLRHQFAKDLSAQVIDKTRAVVKDLHSRITVALHSVDSISKRVERMRDDELLPQILELIQGLIRMWKVMLECHHTQYITISLAYHSKTSAGTPQGDAQKQIKLQLQEEVECFGLSFADWINSFTSYVEALNSWLQNCILQPQERTKSRRVFSPRRVLAPPIFVLCRDLCAGMKSLPSEELSDAIRILLSDLRNSIESQPEELEKKEATPEPGNIEESESNNNDEKNADRPPNLNSLQTSLTKVFDRLTKFSESSVKMYEDVKQKCDTARNAYLNYRPPPRSYTI